MFVRFYRRHQTHLMLVVSWASLLVLVAVPQVRWLTLAAFKMFTEAIVSPDYRWVPLLAIAMLMVLAWVNDKLKRFDKSWLEWSLFKNKKANVLLLPLASKRLWVVYLALLVTTVPLLAWIEEFLFRYLIHGGLAGVL
ncbi:MAG TPA: hypothetical protein VFK03_02240, partial [Candidatus Saccharimonadales bacterium]|nr:hypothetical protein [Candidatus Saccharimonadales bacterium]